MSVTPDKMDILRFKLFHFQPFQLLCTNFNFRLKMRKQFIFLFALLISSNALLAQVFSEVVKSPDGKVQATVTFDKKRGNASYKVRYKGKEIIKESKLGLKVRGEYLYTGMVMLGSHTATQKGTWKPVWGETEEIEEHYNELTLELKDALKLKMNIVFRVFNDGVGFRYEFPDTKQVGLISVLQDATVFNMAEDFETWWAPSDWDSNEHTYSHTKISEIDATKYLSDIEPFNQHIVDVKAVQTPVTMQSGSGVCVSIAEAALADFGALHLKADSSGHNFTAFVIPGINPEIATVNGLPFKMPWRAILLSPDAAGLLTNHLILNLNEPCKIKGDLSWIKPQKYVGIWWELHIGKSGWNYREADGKPNPRHGANTENVKHYIDFAAKNGFDGVLVEGWNEGWDKWFNTNKAELFDFTKPYPDYDMPEISRYAAEKGVKIIVHHETGAAVPSYEQQMDSAYNYLRSFGFNTIKTGYVGHLFPKGEWHDGQRMVNHYNTVLEKAADHQIMVCAHEPVRPSGMHRTWPNFMACEAARGQEFNAWSKGNDPSHELTLIFTRLLGGPMDYTPGIFQIDLNQFDAAKKERVHTTVAKQLALYVTLYSPLQMAADLPENYEKRPDVFQFIKDVPVDWSETRILNAAIGDYVTTARRQKNAGDWYIGSMTDETPRDMKIKLDFLESKKQYEATIYEDGPDAGYNKNPYPVNIRKETVKKGSKINYHLASGGGCAISIKEIK